MPDYLNQKIIPVGSLSEPLLVTIRNENESDPADLTDAQVQFRAFKQQTDRKGLVIPVADTPDLTISVGTGLERKDNSPTVSSFFFQMNDAQLSALLGDANSVRYGYAWYVRPVGATDYYRAFLGGGFDGYFTVVREGYAGVDEI
jgi:hypothetical protein